MPVDDEGEPKSLFSIAYSKPNERFTTKIIREDKYYNYVHYIMRKIVKRVSEKKQASKKKPRRKRQLPGLTIAPDEPPDRDEIIQSSQKYKRIKLTSN